MLHNRHGGRGHRGGGNRAVELQSGRHHQTADGRLHRRGAAQRQGRCGVRPFRLAAALFLIIVGFQGSASAFSESEALAALVAAYPDALLKFEGRSIYWRDGTVTEIPDDAPKPFEQTLRGASLLDQMRLPYPRGPLETPPAVND